MERPAWWRDFFVQFCGVDRLLIENRVEEMLYIKSCVFKAAHHETTSKPFCTVVSRGQNSSFSFNKIAPNRAAHGFLMVRIDDCRLATTNQHSTSQTTISHDMIHYIGASITSLGNPVFPVTSVACNQVPQSMEPFTMVGDQRA